MNQPLAYEVLIGNKLDALPIPDMTDAIWDRIVTQLDEDLPTDDNPSPPQSPVTPAGSWKGFGLSLIFITIILLLIRTTDNEKPSDKIIAPTPATPPATAPPSSSTPAVVAPVKAPGGNNQKPVPSPSGNGPGGVDRQLINPPLAIEHATDTAAAAAPPPVILPKTLPIATETPQVVNPGKDSTGKKPRGVPGIGNDDYRIEPSKPRRKD